MPVSQAHSDRQAILDSIRHLVEAARAYSRNSERELGISGAQLFILQKLSFESGLSMNELADRTLTHQSSVSAVVTRLEEKNLVERRKSAADARRVEVRLTPQGKTLLTAAPSSVGDRLISAISRFSEDDRQRLARLLADLNHHAGFTAKTAPLFFEGETP